MVLFFLKVVRCFLAILFVFDLVLFDPLSTSCLTFPIWGSHFSLFFLCAVHSNESWCRSKWSAPNDPSSLSQAADMALQSRLNITDLQINLSLCLADFISFSCFLWLYSFLFHHSVPPTLSQPLFMKRDLLVCVGLLGGGGLQCSSGLQGGSSGTVWTHLSGPRAILASSKPTSFPCGSRKS